MVLVLLLLLLATTCQAATPLHVYQSCLMPDGISGQCRSQPRRVTATADVQAGAALELPIDMRLPCTNTTCAENVDVAEVPPQVPTGAGVSSCSVTLMPWSPFPCTYNTAAYNGVEGQNKTSWCYSQHSKPQQQGYELAQDLVTDGYTNLFHGWLPDAPCDVSGSGGARSSSSSRLRSIAEGPGYGRHFTKVLLTLNFRVAAGRQFDRTYWFQIGRAVAAVGTLTEPTRWLGTDKWWSTTVDLTHLQAYLRPELPTRCSLSNLISNTYNVPLWVEATLQFYWTQQAPSHVDRQLAKAADSGVVAGAAATLEPLPDAPAAALSAAPTTAPTKPEVAAAVAMVSVPDEVVPLIPREDDAESMTVLTGQGDSPVSWPRATFKLPAALSASGNIYRAQLLVAPKADACEEFWAMNPSGAATNNTCGGLSTGEPYREVRVYVNGQLAGFTPIYYTMYTGGVDPRLWSAIVASYTYNLPTYTFDLSPWLPQLNTQPTPSQSNKGPIPGPSAGRSGGGRSTSSGEDASSSSVILPVILPATSRRLTQDASATATQQGAAAGHADTQVPNTMPTTGAPTHPDSAQQQQQQAHGHHHWASAVDADSREGAHTVTVELAGATGNGWLVANTLLLWRAVGPDGQPQAVKGQQLVELETSPDFYARPSSECEPLEGLSNSSDLSVAGKCRLKIRNRSMQASSVLQWQGHRWEAMVRYATAKYDNIVTFNNGVNVTEGALTWNQRTHHEATWSVARQRPSAGADQGQDHKQGGQQQEHPHEQEAAVVAAAAGAVSDLSSVLTQSSVKYDWLNAGVVAAGGAFEYSFNSTHLQPTVYATSMAAGQAGGVGPSSSSSSGGGLHRRVADVLTGDQRHYQRAIMLNVYTPQSPKCVVPENATHTVTLLSSDSSVSGVGKVVQGSAHSGCVRRLGMCGFCGARLMHNVLEWDC